MANCKIPTAKCALLKKGHKDPPIAVKIYLEESKRSQSYRIVLLATGPGTCRRRHTCIERAVHRAAHTLERCTFHLSSHCHSRTGRGWSTLPAHTRRHTQLQNSLIDQLVQRTWCTLTATRRSYSQTCIDSNLNEVEADLDYNLNSSNGHGNGMW